MADTTDKKSPFAPAAEAIAALGEMLHMARMMKSMYDANVEAGFTEDQAIYLAGCMLGGAKK